MKTITITLFLFFSCFAFSQVGVGNTDPKSTLDISASSTTSPTNEDGILIPRIDNFPTVNPTADQDGMLVFYTGTSLSGKGFYYWDNSTTSWVSIQGNEDTDWLRTGTGGPASNITDNIYTLGQVQIGSVNVVNTSSLKVTSDLTSNFSGLQLLHSGSDTGQIGYGIYNQSTITDAVRFSNFHNVNSGTHNNTHYGFENFFINNGTGEKVGLYNEFDLSAPNGNKKGVYNRFEGGNSEIFGIDNSMPGAWTVAGNIYGINNNIRSGGNGQHYGVKTELAGSGSGSKYGYFVDISSTAGGTHYGIYSDVRNTSGYSAYFRGRVSFGNDGINRYFMPASDGTAGQVMTTDGTGNITFQNIIGDGNTQNTLDQAYDEGGAGAGKNITADSGALRINGDDGFLVTGTLGSGNFIDSEVTGVGTRMFFNPNKAAFRAGYVSTNQWDNTNIGSYSVAFGSGTTASGEVSSAFGAFTIASGQFSMASGAGTTASGQTAIASGTSTTASGDYSTAFGYSTLASGNYSTVFGNDNTASGRYSSVFGNSNTAPSAYETVIGINSTNYTPNSTTSFNNNDRLFVVGNGSMPTMRSNALTIYKDGRMTINDAYTMPTIDGTAGQVMTTDGAGNVTFQDIVGDGDTQNTLDQAYNEGGSGAGNTITANAGAVTIDGTDGILVSGILGSGATISSSIVNPTMFFNPRTGSFRSGTSSGTSWDASNTGTFSVAFGSGNTASGYTSTAIGISNVASGARAFSGGSNSISSGLDSFAFGLECTANATGSVSMGVDNTSHSLGEFTVGTYSTNYTAFDTFTWNINDRIFSVGNGSSTSARSNALTIYKSGEVNINDAYSLPTSDGTNGQVMTTDGAGNVTFQNPTTNTDDQQVDNLGLVGTLLGISLEDDGVAPVTVDLASINTDNQQIDNFSFNSTTNILTLEIEDDGQAAQTVDLSSLNPTKSIARMYMSLSQTETGGGTTKVNFDTVDFDTNSNFNTTTDEFTVPADGIYRVTAQITLDSSTATGVFGVRIRVDGTQERRSEYNHHGNGELVRQVTSILNLTAGQTIDVSFVRPAVGATINQNARATFFEIEQL